MRSWIIAAALALAAAPACADPLPPPTPEDVAVRVSADQSGQTINAAEGENIAIELQSNPSTGGRWSVAAKPDFLDAAGEQGGPVNEPVNGRRMVGAPVWQVFLFTANASGSGALTLELRGPGGQVWETFNTTINVQ